MILFWLKFKKKTLQLKSETQDDNRSLEDAASKKRDEELTDLVRKYENNKRSAPLVETHKQKVFRFFDPEFLNLVLL